VVPLLDAPKASDPPAITNIKPTTRLQATFFNLIAILMVCAAGVLGWYVSNHSQGGHNRSTKQPSSPSSEDDILSFNLWGQIFGYFCAVLYLGSRVPQILLNYRRKSTEGVSMLFFLFACIGNLTYVLSIFAYEPHCRGKHGRCRNGEALSIYGRYIAVNASWLAGSLGTLFLDLGIFAQFFLYRDQDEDDFAESAVENGGIREERRERDQRPLLDRGDSEY
jgi:solute carrier family 66 (lysosomal lysine-arginine transporter), member 1